MNGGYIAYDDKERVLTVGTAKELAKYLEIKPRSVVDSATRLKRGVINPKIKIYRVRGVWNGHWIYRICHKNW